MKINSSILRKHKKECKKEDDIDYKKLAKELVKLLNKQWTTEKIKLILDIVSFLSSDSMASNNVKSLENLMEIIDKDTYKLIGG